MLWPPFSRLPIIVILLTWSQNFSGTGSTDALKISFERYLSCLIGLISVSWLYPTRKMPGIFCSHCDHPFIVDDNFCIGDVLGNCTLFPAEAEKLVKGFQQSRLSILDDFWWYRVSTWCFAYVQDWTQLRKLRKIAKLREKTQMWSTRLLERSIHACVGSPRRVCLITSSCASSKGV